MNKPVLFHKMATLKPITLLAVAAATLLTGCIVTSVYPFYTEKDLISDPAVLGQWTKVGEPEEHWKFEAQGSNVYLLTYTTGSQTNLIHTRLFKLQGERFLDLFPAEDKLEAMPPPIPSHLLLHVLQVTPALRLAPLNHDWLRDFLQKQPKAISHEILKIGDKPDDVRVVLTAATAELQKFILSHLKTEEAWKNEFELKRD
jgi:hypothetical protein